MQHAINQCYECMRAIKESDSETRSVNPSQLGGRHSNPVVTTPMIALDFSGTTTQSASHNVALNQVVNQYANQAQDQSQQQANRFHSREIQSCLRFKPLRAAQFVPQSSEFYLTDSIHGTEELTANATSFLLVRNSRQKLQGTEIQKLTLAGEPTDYTVRRRSSFALFLRC
ncbi:hypothetical protein F511_22277 [Dorcoceras hygrometricum]|uniref:Uncharacterized protein n=1 Tax=Dorcoceras hygrometricum TaxID=472368 RepID=A0A2Z7A9A4_9LAMI|nr:hypothetical protein F511_22277 [Dorcoceras hygrometricum]